MPSFRSTIALAALAASALAAPDAGAAFLQEPDESPKWFTTSFGPRFMLIEQQAYRDVYADSGLATAFQLTFGWVPISRYVDVEMELGIAYAGRCGSAVNVETSEQSADRVLLKMFPLSAGVLLGIDPVPEFPIVPFGRVGIEVVPWSETDAEVTLSSDDSPLGEICGASGGGSTTRGAEWTWHAGFGLQILLDRIEPARASALDAKAGINDTYLVLEARRASTLARSAGGVDLTSWSVLATLKFAY
ncbi:hypothetical protein L6R50_15890 [Myxococcota bacterium]|nr:hypothetical protein [Myxococcota bacterium]